ncbi:glycoside hydrolase family 9 protein [Streptomyces sp. NPDC001530]|uniref:glycoside hydrolase family 9 protein n=1 Tax=Streptomyces sp. NPDC001530 TaxID=3364582 RepID=UPI0036B34B19
MSSGDTELALAARELGDDREDDWADAAAGWAGDYLDSDVKGTLNVADVSALAHVDLATVLDGDRTNGIGAEELYEGLRRQLDDGVERAGHDPFGAGAVYDDFDAVPHTFGLVATARLYAKATGDTEYEAFADRQCGWALGVNAWGTSFVIGAGEVFPHCPERQLANLRGSHDGKGAILRGAVVNGPNEASKLEELNGEEVHGRPADRCLDGLRRQGRAVRRRRGRLADRGARTGLHDHGAAGLRPDRTGRRPVAPALLRT